MKARAERQRAYFELGKPNRGSHLSNDPILAQKLWAMTERLLKRGGFGVGSNATESK